MSPSVRSEIAFTVRCALIFAWVFFTQSQAHANWLSLCHHQAPSILEHKDDRYLAHYLAPDESVSQLQLTKQPADNQCSQVELSITAQDVLWSGFAPSATAAVTDIALQGTVRGRRFLVSEVILPELISTAPVAPEKNLPPPKKNQFSANTIKSAWFWSPALWMDTPEKIFKAKAIYGINRIYISVPTNNGELSHAAELRQFIQNAHRQGLQVWAVLGDQLAVTKDGAAAFLTASAAYGAFNDDNTQSEKLDGLQLDIEPYLIPGYAQDPAAWLSKYAYVVNNIHLVAPNIPINIVLPFWFDPDSPQIATMLEDVMASIKQITVMDYRTGKPEILQKAIKFLDWGLRHQKAIEIALETLPLNPEQRRYYRPAPMGELWGLEVGGKRVLLLLKEPRPADAGVSSYHFIDARLIDGTSISFYKTKDQLKELLAILETELSVWPSFSGLAIHGLDHGLTNGTLQSSQ